MACPFSSKRGNSLVNLALDLRSFTLSRSALRAPACFVNVCFCPKLIEFVETEGLGGSGMVAPTFGDVQVTAVFHGHDDGGADGA